MKRRTWLPAACVLALLGCGPLETRSYTYEPVASASPGPALYMASTRTLETGWSEELRFEAPYKVSVSMDPADAEKPFEVRSLSFEHEGKTTVAHASSDAPLESALRDPKAPTKQMIVWVPLEPLTFVEGSKLSVKAEVRMAGAPDWVVVERTFAATKEEKAYSACQRMAMH